MYKLALVFVVFLLGACATQFPPDSPFYSEPAKGQPYSELIYQGDALLDNLTFAEVINGKLANSTYKWTGLKWKVPPGKVDLYLYAKVSSSMAAYDEFEFNVEAGKKYHIYREIKESGVEIYILENDVTKIYSNTVQAEKRRRPKYKVNVIIF